MHTVIAYIIYIYRQTLERKRILLNLPSRGQCWSVNCPSFSSLFGNSWDKKEGERGGGEGGDQRCKWIYSSDHRHRENKQFQLKHFLLRWEGEGWRLQRGQTLWTSARLLCFTVWDTASAGHSQAFKIPPSPSNAPLASIKKKTP